MLTLLVIAPLLCGQLLTDAPERTARLTAETPTTGSWVKPALVVAGASFPILAGAGFALTIPLLGAWSMPLMLAVAGAAAIGALVLFGAILLGLALDESAAKSKQIQPGLPVWPWVTTAVSLIPISGLFAGVAAILGTGTHALFVLLLSGLFIAPVFAGLLVTGLIVGLVNAARAPGALQASRSASGTASRCCRFDRWHAL